MVNNMKIGRNITSKIDWLLDYVVPPILREWKPLMWFIIQFAYGPYTKYVMEFKDKYPNLSQEEINTYYSLIADAPINHRATDLNSQCLRYIMDLVSGNGETEILDAACGRGYLAQKIHDLGSKHVTGVDVFISEELKAASSETLRFVEGQLQKLPFDDEQFDVVICSHALEHIREYKICVRELVRVAKNKVIIIVPKQREYKYTPDLHVNFFPYMYSFLEFLHDAGIPVRAEQCVELGGDFLCVYDKWEKN